MSKKNKIKKEIVEVKEEIDTVVVEGFHVDGDINTPDFYANDITEKNKKMRYSSSWTNYVKDMSEKNKKMRSSGSWTNSDELSFIDNMGGVIIKKPSKDAVIQHLIGYLNSVETKDWERCGLDKYVCVNRAKTRLLMYGVNYDLTGN